MKYIAAYTNLARYVILWPVRWSLNKVADRIYGPEEDFEYVSTTTPPVHTRRDTWLR